MINAYLNPIAFDFKVCFDGYDYLNSQIGQEFCNPILRKWINEHHNQHDLSFAEAFIEQCIKDRQKKEPDHPLPVALRDKYEVGLFTTSHSNCFRHPYVLFNEDALRLWHSESVQTFGQTFLVRPSRGRDGKINELAFRILDCKSVNYAFKWIFMCGQQATFGLQNSDADALLTVVEGAWDEIAFAESGVRNVVGLGSARLTEQHKAILGSKVRTCWDQDRFGLAERANSGDYCFFAPSGKDPFDAFIQHGKVLLVEVAA